MSDKEWQPPKDAIIHIVCAANKKGDIIVAGARHWDSVMRNTIGALKESRLSKLKRWEQGFIDQFGRFHSRKAAMKFIAVNNQPFNKERNGNGDDLYSEGLY
jgi:hypothetical protein